METVKNKQNIVEVINHWEDNLRFLTDENGERQGVILTPEQYDYVAEAVLNYREVRDSVLRGLQEIKLHQEGKIQLTTWEEFLDEL